MYLAKHHLLLGLALQFGLAGVALAAATEAEIARLGQDLTCVGAEKAGNADGSIPEWSGKWRTSASRGPANIPSTPTRTTSRCS